jgi:hypothetical protein
MWTEIHRKKLGGLLDKIAFPLAGPGHAQNRGELCIELYTGDGRMDKWVLSGGAG